MKENVKKISAVLFILMLLLGCREPGTHPEEETDIKPGQEQENQPGEEQGQVSSGAEVITAGAIPAAITVMDHEITLNMRESKVAYLLNEFYTRSEYWEPIVQGQSTVIYIPGEGDWLTTRKIIPLKNSEIRRALGWSSAEYNWLDDGYFIIYQNIVRQRSQTGTGIGYELRWIPFKDIQYSAEKISQYKSQLQQMLSTHLGVNVNPDDIIEIGSNVVFAEAGQRASEYHGFKILDDGLLSLDPSDFDFVVDLENLDGSLPDKLFKLIQGGFTQGDYDDLVMNYDELVELMRTERLQVMIKYRTSEGVEKIMPIDPNVLKLGKQRQLAPKLLPGRVMIEGGEVVNVALLSNPEEKIQILESAYVRILMESPNPTERSNQRQRLIQIAHEVFDEMDEGEVRQALSYFEREPHPDVGIGRDLTALDDELEIMLYGRLSTGGNPADDIAVHIAKLEKIAPDEMIYMPGGLTDQGVVASMRNYKSLFIEAGGQLLKAINLISFVITVAHANEYLEESMLERDLILSDRIHFYDAWLDLFKKEKSNFYDECPSLTTEAQSKEYSNFILEKGVEHPRLIGTSKTSIFPECEFVYSNKFLVKNYNNAYNGLLDPNSNSNDPNSEYYRITPENHWFMMWKSIFLDYWDPGNIHPEEDTTRLPIHRTIPTTLVFSSPPDTRRHIGDQEVSGFDGSDYEQEMMIVDTSTGNFLVTGTSGKMSFTAFEDNVVYLMEAETFDNKRDLVIRPKSWSFKYPMCLSSKSLNQIYSTDIFGDTTSDEFVYQVIEESGNMIHKYCAAGEDKRCHEMSHEACISQDISCLSDQGWISQYKVNDYGKLIRKYCGSGQEKRCHPLDHESC
jgi:hypothetical protein